MTVEPRRLDQPHDRCGTFTTAAAQYPDGVTEAEADRALDRAIQDGFDVL